MDADNLCMLFWWLWKLNTSSQEVVLKFIYLKKKENKLQVLHKW